MIAETWLWIVCPRVEIHRLCFRVAHRVRFVNCASIYLSFPAMRSIAIKFWDRRVENVHEYKLPISECETPILSSGAYIVSCSEEKSTYLSHTHFCKYFRDMSAVSLSYL